MHDVSPRVLGIIKKALNHPADFGEVSLSTLYMMSRDELELLATLSEATLDELMHGYFTGFRIPLKNLIKNGLVEIREINGYKYIVLCGETLDPVKNPIAYAKSDELYPTLLKEHGLSDLYEKYRDKIIKPRPHDAHKVLATLIDKGIMYRVILKKNKPALLALKTFVPRMRGREIVFEENEEGNGTISLLLPNPSSEDIETITHYMEYTELLVKETIYNVIESLRQNTGIKDASDINMWVYASLHMRKVGKNIYSVEDGDIKVGVWGENSPVYVGIEYSVSKDARTIQVVAEYNVVSEYVARIFRALCREKMYVKTPLSTITGHHEYRVIVESDTVSLVYTIRSGNAAELSPIYSSLKILKQARYRLRNILMNELMKHRSDPLVFKSEPGQFSHKFAETVRVGDVLDAFRWSNSMSREERLLKLVVAKTMSLDKVFPPLLDYFVADTILSGHSEGSVKYVLEYPLEYLVSLILSGKLRIVPSKERGQVVLLRNKPLEEYMDTSKIGLQFYKLLNTAYMLAKSQEELRLLRRANCL